jgi:predicted alpha-1,6-mannanase (GH76 family)
VITRRVLTLTATFALALAPLLSAAPQSAAASAPPGNDHGQSSALGASPSTVVGHSVSPDANTSAQNIYPDVRDPSLAANDRVAATASVSSRNITLHIDDPDDMAWADISNGSSGDETWLDRSYDGGQTWASGSKLGDTTIPSGDSEWRTMMYNIDNPSAGQVGVIRACGEAAGQSSIACTPWLSTPTVVQNIYPDGRDPSLAASSRVAATVSVWSRNITLHVDDTDDMAWADISNGSATDETWLDRSFDGGQTWASGSKLGDTTIPSGDTEWRTMMYNIDSPLTEQVGAVRACGKAGNRTDIVCTPWLRSTTHASDSRSASATALAQLWNPRTGNWSSNASYDWKDAIALTALIGYMQESGDSTYSYIIRQVYLHNILNNGSQVLTNFTDSFLDDTGWWGMAWLRAYDYTHNATYLQIAEADANYMAGYWDTGTCGGGVWWTTGEQQKNSVENELYLELNAELHNQVSGDTTYLQRAEAEWTWFSSTGLINSQNLVNDGLDLSNCQNDHNTQTWTYNQGVVLDGLAQLYKATGNAALLTQASKIATATTSLLATNGVLTEPGTGSQNCGSDDWTAFKGIFIQNLQAYATDANTSSFQSFMTNQKTAITADDTNGDGQSGYFWAGPLNNIGYGCQASALDAIDAAG